MTQAWHQKATVQSTMVNGFFIIFAAAISAIAAWRLASQEISQLKIENKDLAQAVSEQSKEILQLETQLTPFKTEALRRFGGIESEALARLAGQLNAIESSLEILRNYSDVARLNMLGKEFSEGGGIKISTPVSRMLEGTYIINDDGGLKFKLNQDGELTYQAVISKFPRFPFPYYLLAACLKQKGDSTWHIPARQAVDLLQKTTQIEGHNMAHDEILVKAKQLIDGEYSF